MNILIIAGEISGDLYASYLAKEIKNTQQSTLYCIGGEKLKENCDHFIFSSTHNHGVGIEGKFTKRRYKKELLSTIHKLLVNTAINKVIIVDFQHYNEKIANIIPKSIQIYTFITPNFWMWKSKKHAKKITAYSTKIFTIFNQEFEFYKTLSNNIYYFGHPLTEITNTTPKKTNSKIPQITLFPGSRPQEFKLYFQTMLETMDLLQKKNSKFNLVICVSSNKYIQTIEKYLNKYPTLNHKLSYSKSTEEIKNSTLVIAASGSTTLEVILLKKPLIVLAALPKLSYFLAKYILRIKLPYISLPNFIANKPIVSELVQSEIKSKNLYLEVLKLLKNPEKDLKNYKFTLEKLKKSDLIFQNITKELFK